MLIEIQISEWEGGIRISTASSAAGATAKVAVVVQTGTGFLSGGRHDATAKDREDCFGRATVAPSRAILCTYIVSPIDMAGRFGMAQVLACQHSGYYILRAQRLLQRNFADPASDSAAVLDWSPGQSFMPTSGKPPLAIAMQSSREGSTRRHRPAAARKDSLPTGTETTKVLNKLDKSLPQCLPGSIDDDLWLCSR